MGKRVKLIFGGMCMVFAVIIARGEERLFEPDWEFEGVYKTELNRIRSVTDRFLKVHIRNLRLLEQTQGSIDDLSLFICFPSFCSNEVVSVFWDRSTGMIVKTDGADLSVPGRFNESCTTHAVRQQLKKYLNDYQFLMPLGGDGNVTLVGVCVGHGTNIVTRCFSFQEGRLFAQKKMKMFCGRRNSIPAYKAVMQILQEINSTLKSACEERCTRVWGRRK